MLTLIAALLVPVILLAIVGLFGAFAQLMDA